MGISSPDPTKFTQAIKSIQEALGGIRISKETIVRSQELTEASFEKLRREARKIIKDGNLQDVVDVQVNEKGLIINVLGGALFEPGSANIHKGIKPLLLEVALMVKKLPYKILVEGHTDNTKIKSEKFPSNWELSAARAAAVVRVMVQEGGVEPVRFSAIGYAEHRPLFAHTSRNRDKNRRVEIVISREGQGS